VDATLFPQGRSEGSSEGRRCRWAWLGRRPYGPTFALQETLRRTIVKGLGGEWLLLLEHDAVFTVGRNADPADVLATAGWLEREGVEVHETNRGGKVTYHGPGQLVGYPIVDLNPDRRDIGRYVRDLQEVLIRTLADFGIESRRRDESKDFIGIWAGDAKIASIGVHLSRWVAIHGFALNVAPALGHFGGIVACGLRDVEMTSMARRLPAAPAVPDVARALVGHFADIFGRSMLEATAADVDAQAALWLERPERPERAAS
jgi:lipoyl(octanoyl) transferase